MLWFGSSFIALALLMANPPLAHLSIAPVPREIKATVETGVVVVSGQIGTDGRLDSVQLSQGPAVFVQPSLDVVRQWEFERADSGKTPLPITAVFLYRAQTDLPDRADRITLASPELGEIAGSPRPVTIVNPEYPLDSVAEGTVTLQLAVDNAGRVVDVDLVNNIPTLTQAAIDAALQWKFVPKAGIAVAVINFRRPSHTY